MLDALKATTKLKGLLEILASAAEFETMPVRHREDNVLKQLSLHCPVQLDEPKFNDPHTKANVLLQCHFSRREVGRELASDLASVLDKSPRLLQAMVDVISSSGWLAPALATMEISQMCVQAMWERDPMLLQLPHINRELANKCVAAGIESVFDLMDMEDDQRTALLGLSPRQLVDVANACNQYPNVDVSYEVCNPSPCCGTLAIYVARSHIICNCKHTTHAALRGRQPCLTLLLNSVDHRLRMLMRSQLVIR